MPENPTNIRQPNRNYWHRCPDCRTCFRTRNRWSLRCPDCLDRLDAEGTGLGIIIFGAVIAVAAVVALGYFLFGYDTTTGLYFERVHNVGLQQNRLLGVIVSLTAAVGGAALLIVGVSQRAAAIERWRDRKRAKGQPPAAEAVGEGD